MSMIHNVASAPRMRQRVAIVDSTPHSREDARRATRQLGHAPFVFDSVADLQAIGSDARAFAMVLVACSVRGAAVRIATEIRDFVGGGVPMMTLVSSGRHLASMTRDPHTDAVAVRPRRFSDMHAMLALFMQRHGLPTADSQGESRDGRSSAIKACRLSANDADIRIAEARRPPIGRAAGAVGESLRMQIHDEQWQPIESLLRGRARDSSGADPGLRLSVEAVLWIARTGCPWADLPAEFGPWRAAYQRFAPLSRAGVWQQVFATLMNEPRFREAFIDSTMLRVRAGAS